MRKSLFAFAVAAAGLLGGSGFDRLQTTLDVLVLDKVTGKPVEGLSAADFEVLDGGVVQPLSECAAEASPLDILLLLDTGGGFPLMLAGETRRALDLLRQDDRIALMTFAGKSKLRFPFTNDREAAAAELDRISRSPNMHGVVVLPTLGRGRSGAGICEALLKAVGAFPDDRNCLRRRTILIVTDDRRSPSRVLESEVIQGMLTAGVTLSGSIVAPPLPRDLPPSRTGLPLPRASGQSEPCCQATPVSRAAGGDLPLPSSPGRQWQTGAALIETMLHRIRSRYVLRYAPGPRTSSSSTPEIEVRLTGVAKSSHPDAEIRFRAGYCP